MNLGAATGPIFVGRQQEMVGLKSALDDAIAGRGRLVMLAGEPGIGKTRMAQELAIHAQGLGACVLWGWCYEEEGAPPYWPWIQPIRSYFRETDANRLSYEMGPGAADIAEVISEVRDKLPDLERPPTLDPQQARFRLFDSITGFLKNASSSQPLMLVLEDLHWADKPSLLFLEFLAWQMADSRLLLVGTYRDIEVSREHPMSQTLGNITRELFFARFPLAGLSQQEVGQFIAASSHANLASGAVEAIHSRTEGNPLFVSQVVQLLAQEQPREGGDWSISLPAGVRDVIGRRLSRLSEQCNQVPTTAAVIGRQFDYRLLGTLNDGLSEGRLLDLLDEALKEHLIEEVPSAGERYQFSHALVKQTLSEELSTSRKVRMHLRIGQALETLYGAEAEAYAVELAYHFGEAQSLVGSTKFVGYSLLAGEQAPGHLRPRASPRALPSGPIRQGKPVNGRGSSWFDVRLRARQSGNSADIRSTGCFR